MSIILELTPEEEARLQAQANRRGQSADMMARALFRRGLDLEDVPMPHELTKNELNQDATSGLTLADTLQEFIGIVDSRTMGPQASDKPDAFTDILAEKARRQGLSI